MFAVLIAMALIAFGSTQPAAACSPGTYGLLFHRHFVPPSGPVVFTWHCAGAFCYPEDRDISLLDGDQPVAGELVLLEPGSHELEQASQWTPSAPLEPGREYTFVRSNGRQVGSFTVIDDLYVEPPDLDAVRFELSGSWIKSGTAYCCSTGEDSCGTPQEHCIYEQKTWVADMHIVVRRTHAYFRMWGGERFAEMAGQYCTTATMEDLRDGTITTREYCMDNSLDVEVGSERELALDASGSGRCESPPRTMSGARPPALLEAYCEVRRDYTSCKRRERCDEVLDVACLGSDAATPLPEAGGQLLSMDGGVGFDARIADGTGAEGNGKHNGCSLIGRRGADNLAWIIAAVLPLTLRARRKRHGGQPLSPAPQSPS